MTKKTIDSGIIKSTVKPWKAGGAYIPVPSSMAGKEVIVIPLDWLEGIEIKIKKSD